MELFSEIYNCYYQVVDSILAHAEKSPITEKEMQKITSELGFAESGLYILPRLISGEWKLLSSADGLHYQALTKSHGQLPLTTLQRSWIKSLLLDARFCLFFEEPMLQMLENHVQDAEILWRPEDFHYYDQFSGGDPYDSPKYQNHFRTLLHAIPRRQYVKITYESEKGHRITHRYLPLKLEYSAKNDQFRLLAMPELTPSKVSERHVGCVRILNLRGIRKTSLSTRFEKEELDFTALIQKSYYKEPLRLCITNQRNALERAMLHFASYEKQTKKTDENTWECLIYYNNSMETELLIEVLSFGPAIKVLGPESFLNQVKERLRRQMELISFLP